MFLKTKGKQRYIRSALTLALTGILTVGTIFSTGQPVMARKTLPGIEKIIQSNSKENPFVILEIIPEEQYASLGYFVAGEEPVDESGKSIKDMPDKEERAGRFGASNALTRIENLGLKDAVSFSTFAEKKNGSRQMDIRGIFEEVGLGGSYKKTNPEELYIPIFITDADVLHEINQSRLTLYRKYTSLRMPEKDAGKGENTYQIELKKWSDSMEMPLELEDGTYNEQYFTGQEIVEEDLTNGTLKEGDMLFRVEGDSLVYVGILKNKKVTSGSGERVQPIDPTEEETTEENPTEEVSTEENSTEEETLSPEETLSETEEPKEEPEKIEPVNEEQAQEEVIEAVSVHAVSVQAVSVQAESVKEEVSVEEAIVTEPIVTVKTVIGNPATEEKVTEEETTTPDEAGPAEETTVAEEPVEEETKTEVPATQEEETKPEETTVPEEVPTEEVTTSEEATTEEGTTEEGTTEEEEEAEGKRPEKDKYDKLNKLDKELIDRVFRAVEIPEVELDFNANQYVKVEEADGDDEPPYYYISAVTETGGVFAAEISFGEIMRPTGGYPEEFIGKEFYIYNEGTLPYMYAPGIGTYEFRADYTKEIYDTFFYDGGFKNAEWFKKYVFDLDENQYESMCIDVVPVTLSKLTQEMLDSADLIYIADPENAGFIMADNAGVEAPEGKWISTFTFDDDSGFGTDYADASKEGEPQLKDKDSGKALYLDGEDDYLEVSAPGLVGTTEMTISFIMKPESADNRDWAFYAAADGNTQVEANERYLGISHKNKTVEAQRYLNTGATPASATGNVPEGKWSHVAVVYTETATLLYINGEKVSVEVSEYALADIMGSSPVIQIGKANIGSGEYFKGQIDDYVIANYAIPEQDIKRLAKTENIYNAIIKKAAEGVPIALDRSLYMNTVNDLTLRKMAACLMHEDILYPFGNAGVDGKAVSTLNLEDLEATMKKPSANGSMSYVNNNVFVFDSENKSDVVSGDFDREIYTNGEIIYGFNAVLTEIDNENFYLELAGETGRIERKVTMATAFRYIINHGDRRNVTKTTLRVLDLEPYDFEDYYPESQNFVGTSVYKDIRAPKYGGSISVAEIETDSICITEDGKLDKQKWIIDNLASQFENNREDLSVKIMGTREFIGKIEDINENYDLIYLGMDTSIMNTTVIENEDGEYIKTDETVYNDSSLDGRVYIHVGDMVNIRTGKINNENRYFNGNFRMSGNDITADKLRELREYIEAGYAVIVSDEMFIENSGKYTINQSKIDPLSNMYTLLDKVVLAEENGKYRYFGKNVNVKSAFEDDGSKSDEKLIANRETFSRYMGISKLILEYSEADLPLAYNEGDGNPDYLSMDADGLYRLKYHIKLRNDAAVDWSGTYNCKLYVDADANGRYEEVEVLTGLKISDESGNERIADETGKFHLNEGHTYFIYRVIPDGYTGFIAWKLVFEQNGQEFDNVSDRALVRSSIEGYSAVPHSGDKPTIKILQIVNKTGSTNLDLKNDAYMKGLYQDEKLDFKIDVTKISSSQYVDKSVFQDKSHSEYLKEFDMIVMGFADSYQIGVTTSGATNDELTKEAMLAIREYALSGRSILFTHDLSGFNLTDDSEKIWSWWANRYLRDIQGMDRFGVMSLYGTIPNEDKYKYESKYDSTPYLDEVCLNDGTLEQEAPHALNNILLTHSDYKKNVTYAENARAASWLYKFGYEYNNSTSMKNYKSTSVTQLNKGQITEYPYKITDNFLVTLTHGQYMQLNLDTDSRDENGNDDIVVWYTLDKHPDAKDSLYATVKNDARNTYFIFNKGNITYTGSGHTSVTSEMEKRLFLNTLVAAYRGGVHAPYVVFKENEWENSANILSMYLPYDPQINDGAGSFLDEDVTVHFYTTNSNLQVSNEPLYAKYYVDGTQSNHDIYVDGKYYKEIQIKSMQRMVEENGELKGVTEENASNLLNNSMYTATITYSELGLGGGSGIKDNYAANLYIRLSNRKLEEPDEIDGNKILDLSAYESMRELQIVCTQLFELR